jgi:twitching motility two-component system response regulator PilH
MSINKILVVDDSKVDLMSLQQVAEEAGYTAITATNGVEAIEKAETEKPDLIFLDVMMQPIDGYQACRELLQNDSTKNIPIVFVTVKGEKADRLWAEMQGAKGFVQKPFTYEEIIREINKLK